jgi:hypothetical protein
MAGMSRRILLWLVVALVAFRLVALVALCAQPSVATGRGNLTGDIRRFHKIAIEAGVPYRDRQVEYPLLTYGVIRVLAIGNVPTSARTIAVFSFLCDLAVAAALAYGWSKKAALVYLIAGLAYLVYPLIYLRLDLLSIALALWGLALVRRHKPAGGGILMGVAVFTKLWPGLLLPLSWVVRRSRSAYVMAATMFAGLGAWAVIGGTSGPMQVVTFRGARGWQIESVIGAFVRTALSLPVHPEAGALRVGTVPAWARTSLTLLLGLTILAVLVWMYRAVPTQTDADEQPGYVDGVAPIAMITAMLVFSPLFSPQYGVWLLPFGAIAWWAYEREVATWTFAVTTGSAVLLSRIVELKNGGPIELTVVTMRNMSAIILLALTLYRIAKWSKAQRALRTKAAGTAAPSSGVSAATEPTAAVGQN